MDKQQGYTFVFDADVDSDALSATFGDGYTTWVFTVDVKYGALAETIGPYPMLGTVAPQIMPKLPQDVNVVVTWAANGVVAGTAFPLGRMELYDSDTGRYLGDRFYFRSDLHLTTDNNTYTMRYLVDPFEVKYGYDLIKVKGASGDGQTFSFAD